MECPCLKKGDLTLTFDARYPAVLCYGIGGRPIAGDPQPEPPRFLVHDPVRGGNADCAAAGLQAAYSLSVRDDEVDYRVTLSRGDQAAIAVTIAFSLSPTDLQVSLRDIQEHAGFRLVYVEIRRLASARARDAASRLLLPTHGGRRIDPARCRDGERLHRYNWVRDSYCQVGGVYTSRACALLELESLNDCLLSAVGSVAGERTASLGVRMVHRMEARKPELQFVVHRASRFRVSLFATQGDDPLVGWLPAAIRVRDRLRGVAEDRYAGRFVYKVFVGKPGTPAEIPFAEVLRGIRRRFHLLDGAAQICYLVGFQHEGHDSGYPDVFTVNQAAGGLPGLRQLIAGAQACNTVVTFHDNYDDAYPSSPGWDPADIATDSAGEPMRGGVWNGIQAYWISLPKYVRAKARERLRRTMAMYGVRETYHLDVLTASVFRTDFDPADPHDRNDDLQARKELVELFRQEGIDVTSEGAGLPFLETFRYFWELPRPSAPVYEGDEPIPFAACIAHGIASYGGSRADRWGIIEGLLHGSFYSKDVTVETPEQELLDAFYLLQAPLDSLRGAVVVDYREQGATRTIVYSDGSSIELDLARLRHRLTRHGFPFLEDFSSLTPGPRKGTWIAYASPLMELSLDSPRTSWPCPAEWRSLGALRATPLTAEGEGERFEARVTGDSEILLEIPAGVPCRLEPAGGSA